MINNKHKSKRTWFLVMNWKLIVSPTAAVTEVGEYAMAPPIPTATLKVAAETEETVASAAATKVKDFIVGKGCWATVSEMMISWRRQRDRVCENHEPTVIRQMRDIPCSWIE